MGSRVLLAELGQIVRKASDAILQIYRKDNLLVEDKSDGSPLTQADLISNQIICSELNRLSYLPILSEETQEISYEQRKNWDSFWLVDPLDGTREFLKGNGEFTVNIGLIENGRPVLGVIGVPTQNVIYFGEVGSGAFRIVGNGNAEKICPAVRGKTLRVAGSRSHSASEFDRYVLGLQSENLVDVVVVGSSLKFCYLAEGKIDVYPRLGPTKEWDTAAGHAISNAVGIKVLQYNSSEELAYNKESVVNPWFIAGTSE